MIVLKHSFFAALLLAGISGFIGCSGSDFQGGASKKKAKKDEATDAGDSTPESEEEIPVDHPAMVSGAFLTCLEITGDDVAKCKVEKDGDIVDISDVDVKWKVLDAFNREMDKPIFPMEEGSDWHVKAVIGEKEMRKSRVAVDISKEGYTRSLETVVQEKEDVKIDISQYLDNLKFGNTPVTGSTADNNDPIPTQANPATQQLGIDEDFQVGDGSFAPSANRDCEDQTLQNSTLQGKTMRFPFTVEDASVQIGIILEDVCGAINHHTDIARVISATSGQELSRKGISSGRFNHVVSMPAFQASKGNYILEISSNRMRSGDYDDYVVGRIRFNVDGKISIGAGTAQ